jgi:hypothetical protein
MSFQDFREFLGALHKHGELIDIADVPGRKGNDFAELRKLGDT